MSDEKCRTATQFGGTAEPYFGSEVRRLGADRETLVSQCRGTARALSVAIGAGHTVGVIADANVSSVVAADVAPEAVTTTAHEYPVAGVVANAEHPPFADDALDAAACRIVTHHFPDPETFAAEVARAFEPDGAFTSGDDIMPEDAALATFLNGTEVLRDPTYVELHPVSRWHE